MKATNGLFAILSIGIFLSTCNVYGTIMGGSTTASLSTPDSLKLLLVEFADVRGDSFWDASSSEWVGYTHRHTLSDFAALLSSLGTYTGSNSDGDPVYGSFRDYFWDMSKQTYNLKFKILNPDDGNGYPVWVKLPNNKSTYTFWTFKQAARDSAVSQLGVNVSSSSDKRLCHIYAGRWDPDINVATTINGWDMVVPERECRQATPEQQADAMSHIGYFCHEFVHMLGAAHTNSATTRWALMRNGHKNGTQTANRPAPVNPWFLADLGWASIRPISYYMPDSAIVYNTSSTNRTTFFTRSLPGDIKYMIENKQRGNTFDESLPHAVVSDDGGLLIWRVSSTGLSENATSLIPADNDPVDNGWQNMSNDLFRPTGTYAYSTISDYSSPANLKIDATTFSHFAVSGYTQNENTITVDLVPNYWSGAITSNTIWSSANSPYYIGGDITVESGVTLTIESGTTVNFLAGQDDQSGGKYSDLAEIIVNGTLDADNVTFSSQRGGTYKGDWGGIWLNEASNSSLTDCTLKNGHYPLWIEDCSPLIDGNSISHASGTGIVVKGSTADPDITDNMITTVNNIGITVVQSANPDIYGNTINSPNRAALYFNESAAGHAWDNDLSTEYTEYVYCYANSGNPVIAGDMNQSQNGNDIHNTTNKTGTIFRVSGGYPYLGFTYYGTNLGNNGLDVDQGSSGYYVRNYTGTRIQAQNNWWGTANPDSTKFYPTSLVNYSNYLSSDPLPKTDLNADGEKLAASIHSFLNKDYNAAEQQFDSLLQTTTDSYISGAALRWLLLASLKTGTFSQYESRLQALCDDGNAEVAHVAKLALAKLFACTKRMEQAEVLLRSEKSGSAFERESLLTLLLYFLIQDKQQKADDLAAELTGTFKGTDIIMDIEMAYESQLLFEPEDLTLAELAKPAEEISATAAENAGDMIASPNPFNPDTKITYRVQHSGNVHMSVYNILGKRIRTLFDGHLDSGFHSVTWDGKDELFRPVGSGLYFVKLQTAGGIKVIKISLLK